MPEEEIAAEEVAEPRPPDEWVDAVHPVTGGVSRFLAEAYEEVWEPLGWQRAQLDEDGNPISPPERKASATGTGDTPKRGSRHNPDSEKE